jgi:hypothetical protein
LARLKFRKYFKKVESEELAENPIINNAIKIKPVTYLKIIGKNDFFVSVFNNVIILFYSNFMFVEQKKRDDFIPL